MAGNLFVIANRIDVSMPQGKQTVSDNEILVSMMESDDPAFTTSELAEQHGMTAEGMRNRLESLAKAGRIKSKKPGERSVIWWLESDQFAPLSSQK